MNWYPKLRTRETHKNREGDGTKRRNVVNGDLRVDLLAGELKN